MLCTDMIILGILHIQLTNSKWFIEMHFYFGVVTVSNSRPGDIAVQVSGSNSMCRLENSFIVY
jgi:hypothetical protein